MIFLLIFLLSFWADFLHSFILSHSYRKTLLHQKGSSRKLDKPWSLLKFNSGFYLDFLLPSITTTVIHSIPNRN